MPTERVNSNQFLVRPDGDDAVQALAAHLLGPSSLHSTKELPSSHPFPSGAPKGMLMAALSALTEQGVLRRLKVETTWGGLAMAIGDGINLDGCLEAWCDSPGFEAPSCPFDNVDGVFEVRVNGAPKRVEGLEVVGGAIQIPPAVVSNVVTWERFDDGVHNVWVDAS